MLNLSIRDQRISAIAEGWLDTKMLMQLSRASVTTHGWVWKVGCVYWPCAGMVL